MRRYLVGLIFLSAVLVNPQDAQALNRCKILGGTEFDVCFPAPYIIKTQDIVSGSQPVYFPDIYSAAQWRGEKLRAQSNTSWPKCNLGVKTTELPCGTPLTSGFGCQYTDIQPIDHWPKPVVLWGYGKAYSWSEDGYLECGENYGSISIHTLCPIGTNPILEYPSGDPDKPIYYCRATNLTNGSGVTPTADQYTGAPDGPSDADKSKDCNACGINPVNLSTGAKYDMEVDYINASPFPIKLIRYYSNHARGWHFNYDIRIERFSHLEAEQTAWITSTREDGTQITWRSIDADPALDASEWTWTPVQRNGSNTILSRISVSKSPGVPVSQYQIKNLRGETEIFDSKGRLLKVIDELGRELNFTYFPNDFLERITDDMGRYLEFSYTEIPSYTSTWGNLDSEDPTLITYRKWDSIGQAQVHQQRNPSEAFDGVHTISYEYNTTQINSTQQNLISKITQADGSQKQYVYAPQNNGHTWLTGVIGENGETFATYKYSPYLNPTMEESQKGNGLREIRYLGHYVQDAYGNNFSYSNSSQYIAGKPTGFPNGPCPLEVCSGEGAQLKNITFDVYGNPLTKTDYNNRVTTLTWDGPRALPLTITQATGTPLARTTTFTWHASKRLPLTKVEPIKVGGADGTRTTTWLYDATGRLLSETQSNSINSQTRTRSFTYNALGLVETATDARGKTTEFVYDAQGNLIAQENALGQITTWSDYTPRGLPGKTVNPNGLETLMTYDARDRITQIKRGSTAEGRETWNIAWLPIGKVDRITRPDGLSYKMLYDSAHDLIELQERSVSDALLGRRVFTLDLMGRLVKEEAFDASGNTIASRGQVWNTLSRLYQTKGAQNQTTTLTYDPDGNVTGVSNPLSHTNGASVDALGRTISMVDALNKTSTLAYDVQDNLVSATDARGVSTRYGYNAFNDLLAIYSPDRGEWTMSVDANGNTIQTTDPRGVEATALYDDLNRPISLIWNDAAVPAASSGFTAGSQTATYTWDSCPNGIGRLCGKSDWTGNYAYTYDIWGRLKGEAFIPLGEGFTLSTGYSFDAAGRLVAQVYPSGKAVTYSYGANGRISSIAWAGSNLLENMTHQPLGGPITGWTWSSPGIPVAKSQVAYTYDLDGRMSNISDVEEIAHTYDAASRLGAVEHQPSSDHDMAYTYDAKSRLTSADNAMWSAATSYTYDFGDNRTIRIQGGNGWNYVYGLADNRMTSVSPLVGGVAGSPVSQSYYAMGNLIQSAGKTYSYDAGGRMASASYGPSSAAYQVNASGLRVRKTVSGAGASDEIVVYDDQRRRIGVYKPVGGSGFSVEEELVYLPGSWQIVSTVRGQAAGGSDGVAYPVLSDHLGTPRTVLDPSTGERRWSWSSKEAFADTLPNQNPDGTAGGAFVFNARFPGQFLDTETGLFHNGYRDYDSTLGRYVQSDPIGLDGGWNTYIYTSAHPTGMFDADGLLQRNPDGTLKFTGVRYGSSSHASNYTTRLNMEGYLYADDGTPIEAMLNLDPEAPNFNTDCHGYSFADGRYWINNDQVPKIIKGDGYRWIGAGTYNGNGYTMHPKSRIMNKEDIIIYTKNGEVVHSAIYKGGDKISHKPGVNSDRPENATIDTGWNWRSANENKNYQIGVFRR